MYNPTTRLLTLLELLQAAPQVSGPELAAQLGVDVRTVRHYITILQDAGIPIVSTTGRTGGYALRSGFKLPPLMFSDDEADAVALGLLLVQHVGITSNTVAAATAFGKVQRVLPTVRSERVEALQSVLVLDMPPAETLAEQATLSRLALAAQRRYQVQLRYAKENQMSERILDPYEVVYHRARWYVIGYCHLRQAIRSFRLDRIVQPLTLDSTFERPEDFDGLAYLSEAITTIPNLWEIDISLEMPFDDARQQIPPTLARIEAEGVGVRFRTAIGDLDWMARFLVNLGCPFIIHTPAELRETLRRLVVDLLRIADVATV